MRVLLRIARSRPVAKSQALVAAIACGPGRGGGALRAAALRR